MDRDEAVSDRAYDEAIPVETDDEEACSFSRMGPTGSWKKLDLGSNWGLGVSF